MRIAYLSNSAVPSSEANSVHVVHMCDALAQNGHEVTLFCRERLAESYESIHQFYGVENGFSVLECKWPKVPFGGVFYAMQVLRSLKRLLPRVDLLYARCLYSACLSSRLGIPLIYESHALPRTWFHERVQSRVFSSKNLRGLVLISHALQQDYREASSLLQERIRIVVAPDAARLPMSSGGEQGGMTRVNDGDSARVLYTGSLQPGKGIDTVIAVAQRCPRDQFHVLGGPLAAWTQYEKGGVPENVFYHGAHTPAEVREWQRNADILLLPNQREVLCDKGRVDIARWTSPLKMFEYMASGVPLISSDLPVLREILAPEHNCLMVPPDDVAAWALAIQRLCGDPELRNRLAKNARDDIVQTYNWPNRARVILGHLLA